MKNKINVLDKPFKTFEEQLNILNNRIKTDDETIFHLMRNGYYTIFNFYKTPFLIGKNHITNEDIFIESTHFNEIYSLFEFDKELRKLFFNVLTQFETYLKTLVSYHFSLHFDPTVKETYLDKNNYYSKNDKNIDYIINVLKSFKQDKNKEIIKHYSYKNNIPFWIIIHFVPFGDFSKLYSLLFKNLQTKIINNCRKLYFKDYNINPDINPQFLGNFLRTCSIFRNIAGHNERFYDFKFSNTLNTNGITGITTSKNHHLYTIYEGLKLFLSKNEYDKLTLSLKEALKTLENNLYSIDINIILTRMDFPNNWHK